jgi:hypothetical protein
MSEVPDNTPDLLPIFDGSVDELAQGCFGLQSNDNGKFVQFEENPGQLDGLPTYEVLADNDANASRFYVKPTQTGHFLLRDSNGYYLSSHLTAGVVANNTLSDNNEWQITREDAGFELRSTTRRMSMGHHTNDGELYFTGWLDASFHQEDTLRIVALEGCTDFPEVTLNSDGQRQQLLGDANQPVRGYIDAHAHVTSYEFMGGKFMAGEPFNRWGVEEALKDSKHLHGKDGSLDLIGNLYTFDDITNRYDTRGWPDFPWWPNAQQMSHMGYYHKWMERAYLSGLRVMVTNLVENEVLCWAQSNINPASWINPNSCNVMDSIRLQAQRLHELEDYIDAQAGGPGKGFFHIVTSPEDARATIASGRMAVVMGIEASETFNCGLNDFCTRDTIEDLLQEVYDLGVRSLYPTHKFDNQLAGSAVEDGFINIGHLLSSGRFFETKECDEHTQGRSMASGFPLIGDIDGIREILDAVHLNPEYDQDIEHCNSHGLSELGSYLVNRMIDMKMLVECLSVGRCITLPSSGAGGGKYSIAATGAYSRIRRQFNVPIAKLEGVQERIARIAGNTYTASAAARVTAIAIDEGHKPSVPSAILKYNLTELARDIANDTMDVHGGKAIIRGPKNYVEAGYSSVPVAITVEGANILTRSMITFGQGAIRCHPYVLPEMHAAQNDDLKAFAPSALACSCNRAIASSRDSLSSSV